MGKSNTSNAGSDIGDAVDVDSAGCQINGFSIDFLAVAAKHLAWELERSTAVDPGKAGLPGKGRGVRLLKKDLCPRPNRAADYRFQSA
ncbi:MAG TPA: hypothetical protein VFE60_21970 [Roseiarcus sp.]|nr:hypothetical protein [Roseiarcus sp.]